MPSSGIGRDERHANLAPAQHPHDEIAPVFLAALLGYELFPIHQNPGVLHVGQLAGIHVIEIQRIGILCIVRADRSVRTDRVAGTTGYRIN